MPTPDLRPDAVADQARTALALLGMDVREEDEVDRGVDRAFEGLGGLDVLVNNAGIRMRTGRLALRNAE